MMNYVAGKSETHNQHHNELLQILKEETEKVGVVINERMLNLSPQLIPTLHNQLCEDIKWVIQEGGQHAPLFDLKYLLFLTKYQPFIGLILYRCYREVKKTSKKKNTVEYDDMIYAKFEDYVFLQKAPVKFMFEAKSSRSMAGITNLETEKDEQICYRLVTNLNLS
jgi:protein BCP1